MDKERPEDTGRMGFTVGSAVCMASGVEGKRLFRVEPGNCCSHAIEQASLLMDCSRRASFIGVMDNEPSLVWASHYLCEMAKALMDDAHMGMRKHSSH
ncbi:DUF3077 domain-containing protein [Pseudomonas sp. NPDC090233]|uniref:DUF3077 domain-containing protein n=1 Tax=Pseudomonas sp. NPDC090233 TaxID=3364479 RepID=UPI00383B1205